MSGETPPNTANNNNIVDLLSTLNPASTAVAAAASTTATVTPSTSTIRNDDINVDSSDFVPANRLLTQRQALNNTKQRKEKFFFNNFSRLIFLLALFSGVITWTTAATATAAT